MYPRILLISAFVLTGFFVSSQNTSPYWSLVGNSNAAASSKLGTTNAIPLNLATNNLTRLRIYDNGRVGIGSAITTNNTTRSLNLADAQAVMRILRIHASAAPAVELLSRTSADGPNVAYWDMYAEPSDASFRIRDRQTGVNLDRLTINHVNGYVGIGTTTPVQLLDIAGSTNIQGILNLNSDVTFSGISYIRSNSSSTAVGRGAGVGSYGNSAFGYQTLQNISAGAGNTAVGSYAFSTAVNIYDNTALGYEAGYYFAPGTPSSSTFIGSYSGAIQNVINSTSLGYNAYATANNQIRLGNSSITSVVTASNFFIYSDGRFKRNVEENVPGLAFINKLRPVTYNYDAHGLNTLLLKNSRKTNDPGLTPEESKQEDLRRQRDEVSMKEKEKIHYTGFVAQEVEKAAKELNYDFSGIYKPANGNDVYALSYSDFVVPLVKAVQELSVKTSEIDELKKENNELKERLAKIEKLLALNNPLALANLSNFLAKPVPNPAQGITTIAYGVAPGASAIRLAIINMKGQVLKEMVLPNTTSGQAKVNMQALPAGTYNCTLLVEGQITATQKLVIQK